MSFMHNHTDMTNDVSTERESDIENWSTSDLGIIMLIIAVIVVVRFNLFFNLISLIYFVERNIIIVPAIIGLMLQFNFYFKRAAMKIGVATNSIVKRTTLNNVKTNVVVKTFIAALTMIINLTVKRIYSVTVVVINFVFKKPMIILFVHCFLISMHHMCYLNMSYYSRTVQAVSLSLIILTISFNHIKYVGRRSSYLVALPSGIYSNLIPGLLNLISGLLNGVSPFFQDLSEVIKIGSCILIFYFGSLHGLRFHEIVCTAVTVSIVIFAHDLALSFVEIPLFVNSLLYSFFATVSYIYICALIDCL